MIVREGSLLTIHELLTLIDVDGPNGSICQNILNENYGLFSRVPGSSHNHQAWPGGYLDHVTETMNWGRKLYQVAAASGRVLSFSLSDVLLVMFLHDIEKPWKYTLLPDGTLEIKEELRDKSAQKSFRNEKLKEYGMVLSPQQENAMRYVEGEIDGSHSTKHRAMGSLAALCHAADIFSARLFPDYPSVENNPWDSARRCRSENRPSQNQM